jgi:hypothetical protein
LSALSKEISRNVNWLLLNDKAASSMLFDGWQKEEEE